MSEVQPQHFTTSAEMWVLYNNPSQRWWQWLDFYSGFLLTRSSTYQKLPRYNQLQKVLAETEYPFHEYTQAQSHHGLLLGTNNILNTKWIYLVNENEKTDLFHLEKTILELKIKSIRVFSPIEFSNSLKSSLNYLEYVPDFEKYKISITL